MYSNTKLICGLAAASAFTLSGCDYASDRAQLSELKQQQERQQARLDQIAQQQANLANSTAAFVNAVNDLKKKQDVFAFTEFNPSQTRYFILNNGSIGLAGRIISIAPTNNGSLVHISLVNLLSVPVSNIGFNVTWGGEKPMDIKALPQWQQLLFNTLMNSHLVLLPGEWKDITLTLQGVSPNNLKYLKISIDMNNIQFSETPSAEIPPQ